MKVIVSVIAMHLAIVPAFAQAPSVLTLAQAIDEALVKNHQLVNQHDSIARADLGVRLARNTFQPKITPNILGSFGQTDVSSQTYRVDVAQRFTTGTEVRLGVGTATAQIPGQLGGVSEDIRFYNADTTLTLSQPLLRGFGRDVARRALTSAEMRRVDADRMQTLAEHQVTIDVASAYYRVAAQKSFVDVARRSLDRARTLRNASEAKLDAGLVSQLDVLRAQQLVGQAEIQLFDAQSAVEEARDHLNFLIGRDAGHASDVEMEIPRPSEVPIDVERATSLALSNRLDLHSREEESADAERQIRFARNQLLPQVDVNFAFTRRETSDTFARSFALEGFQFATFFTIAMPVDRTAQQVEFQNAVIDRDRRRRDLATLRQTIADDVRQAVRGNERLVRAVIAAETSVDIGRREVEVAQLRYGRGLSNNLDVVSAESSLLMAESRRIQALADSAVARLRLRALLGILNPRGDVKALSGAATSLDGLP
jgi:outer membrane protein